MNLETLLKHPGLWKGRQQNSSTETLSTGHPTLDAALPSQGWPIGALTELMAVHEGIGEFSLLLPALDSLTRSRQWTALVAPPHVPYAPALHNAGISLERMLVVDPKGDHKNAFWAAEQLLRSGVFSAVVLWSEKNGDDRQQRRLQLAAEKGRAWGVCYRPHQTAKNSSPASLRMVLQQSDNGLQINIVKNRGGRLQCLNLAREPQSSPPCLYSISPLFRDKQDSKNDFRSRQQKNAPPNKKNSQRDT